MQRVLGFDLSGADEGTEEPQQGPTIGEALLKVLSQLSPFSCGSEVGLLLAQTTVEIQIRNEPFEQPRHRPDHDPGNLRRTHG